MYYSLTEAAERLASADIAISANEILRLGVAGRAQIAIPLLKRGVYSSAILRRLDAEWRQQAGKAVTPPEVAQELMGRAVADLSGLYIVPPGHLLELEASGRATLEVVFSLDGEVDYRPYVDAKVEQLRVTEAELSRLLTTYAASQTYLSSAGLTQVEVAECNEDWGEKAMSSADRQSAESAEPAAAEIGPTARQVRRLRTRRHALSHILEVARRAASEPDNYLSVWPEVVRLAEQASPPAPLIGYVDGEGVKYSTDKGVKFFSKEALRKQMNPSAR